MRGGGRRLRSQKTTDAENDDDDCDNEVDADELSEDSDVPISDEHIPFSFKGHARRVPELTQC